jgi:DNA-binding transcriptional LysR family regulator
MVSVTVGNSHEVVRGLLDYRTDVAVLAEIEPHHQLLTIPYKQHPVVVFVGWEHRFRGRKEIRIQELEGERMIVREPGSTTRRAFERALEQARVKPKTVMEIGSREAIREAVARGIGISVVSEAAFAPDPRLWPVHVSDAKILTYANIACLKDRQNARLIRAFLEVVRTGLKRSEQAPPTIGMQH